MNILAVTSFACLVVLVAIATVTNALSDDGYIQSSYTASQTPDQNHDSEPGLKTVS